MSKKSGIRVEVTSSGGKPRNMRHDNMKTISQVKEYSLEDGGIFEKKTVIANTSMEEAVKNGEISHRSFELLQASKSNTATDLQEKLEARSY